MLVSPPGGWGVGVVLPRFVVGGCFGGVLLGLPVVVARAARGRGGVVARGRGPGGGGERGEGGAGGALGRPLDLVDVPSLEQG